VVVEGSTPYGPLRRLTSSNWTTHPDLGSGSGYGSVASLHVGSTCFASASSMYVGGHNLSPDSASGPQSVWRVPSSIADFLAIAERAISLGPEDIQVFNGHLYVVGSAFEVGAIARTHYGIARAIC